MDELIDKALRAGLAGKRVLWACPNMARTLYAFEVFSEFRSPDISGVNGPYMRVDFVSGGQIRFVSATGCASRGFRADLLCLDGVTDERALASLLPCAAGGEVVRV